MSRIRFQDKIVVWPRAVREFGQGTRTSVAPGKNWNYGTRQDFPETGETGIGQEER